MGVWGGRPVSKESILYLEAQSAQSTGVQVI